MKDFVISLLQVFNAQIGKGQLLKQNNTIKKHQQKTHTKKPQKITGN